VIYSIVFGAAAFAAAGYLGARLGDAVCEGFQPFDDGPKPGIPPTAWLVGACTVIGAALAAHGDDLTRLGLTWIIVVALVACWCSDVRCGVVPDVFTLTPLAAVVLAGLLQQETWHLFAALVPFIPFAIAALASKGRGMGWGDVKLAALGGAVLGIGTSMLAFSAACVVAVAIAWFRGRRTEPIAFAPYLVGAIGVCLFFGFVPQ
jgi:prepilin signal peptidase PulO-like enzyme (type II secretory pathway)